LQGIHSRQATDTGLIKLDSLRRIIGRLLQTEQSLPLSQQAPLETFDSLFVHR
jgi:hypothetical protein